MDVLIRSVKLIEEMQLVNQDTFLRGMLNVFKSNLQVETVDWMARTIWGEARGWDLQDNLERIAIAWVIRNRAMRAFVNDNLADFWGRDYIDVMTKEKMFSCYNQGDPNQSKILDLEFFGKDKNEIVRECLYIAIGVYVGLIPDPTKGILRYGNGADHYYSVAIEKPSWALGVPFTRIGDHNFLCLYDDHGKKINWDR